MSRFSSEQLIQPLQDCFYAQLRRILIDIAKVHDIDQDELCSSYLPKPSSSSCESIAKTNGRSATLDASLQCQARNSNGKQCVRAQKEGQDLCGNHVHELKFGRITDPLLPKTKLASTVVDTVTDITITTTDESSPSLEKDGRFIMTWKETIEGIDYLVDANDIVYNQVPEIIGKKNAQGKVILLKDMPSL